MALYWLTQFLCSRRLSSPWKSGKTYCIPSIFIILRERDGFFKIFQFLYIPNLQFFFLYTKFGTSCYEHPIFFWCKPVESTLDVPMTFYYSYGNRAYVTSRALRRFLGIRVRVLIQLREDASAFFEISIHPPFFIPLRFRGIVAHPWNPTFPGRAHVATA